jgi:glycosyltransferase involved in cell wall biosynthesis
MADAVMCVSESVRDDVVRYYGADPEKLYVVPNGVNVDLFTAEGENMRESSGLDSRDRVILFVGGLRPIKRLELLVEALTLLPSEWKLLMVGRGSMEAELRSQVQRLGLMRRVRFAGYVPYPELPAFYRGADVLALTSYSEGYPKVILEALACGVPVVTTPSFRGDEHIESHLTYLQEDTPAAMATAMQQAVSGPPVDVARIRAVYDWRVKAEAVRQVYQKVRGANL